MFIRIWLLRNSKIIDLRNLKFHMLNAKSNYKFQTQFSKAYPCSSLLILQNHSDGHQIINCFYKSVLEITTRNILFVET